MGITACFLVLQHVSNRVLRDDDYRALPWPGLRFFVDGWSQFDGVEYQRIAELGYSYVPGQRSNIVWFPLYPNLMRGAHLVIDDWLIAGIAVSVLAGLGAVIVYWRWLEDRSFTGDAKLVAFGVLLLYPYGWYLFGVVHSDSLFLLLVIGACLLIERDRYVLAGLVAALATATRPTGLAVIPLVILLGLQRHEVLVVPEGATGWVARFAVPLRIQPDRLRLVTLAPAMVLAGIGSWMLYLWVRFGDPIAFVTNQHVYHPDAMPYLKRNFIGRWLNFSDDPRYAITIAGQALVALFVLVMVPRVCRRLGFAYGTYLAVLVAIPTVSTGDFMGTGRYLMAAFPAFAVFGEGLATRPRWAVAWLSGCAALLLLMVFGFSRSWYLT